MRCRKASLTESESGNVLATSGSSRTVISRGGFQPGPRATTRNARKSYSGRNSSSIFRLDFFGIDLSLRSGCLLATLMMRRHRIFLYSPLPAGLLIWTSWDQNLAGRRVGPSQDHVQVHPVV